MSSMNSLPPDFIQDPSDNFIPDFIDDILTAQDYFFIAKWRKADDILKQLYG